MSDTVTESRSTRQAPTPEGLRDMLAGIVDASTGIKGVELVAELAERCISEGLAIPADGCNAALADLVGSGRIVEVEFALPDMPDRIKSLYLPAGTRLVTAAA